MQHISYISIGSNLGNRILNCQIAIKNLSEFSTVLTSSSFYETEPCGYEDENQYINSVLKLTTQLNYTELLSKFQLIERQMGRKKNKLNIYKSRIIDLDILFFDNLIINDSEITIPHPKLYERNFVLKPFCEIDPEFMCPLRNKKISTILKSCNDKSEVNIYPH